MPNQLPLWLCLILLTGFAAAEDIPFVFDKNTPNVSNYTKAQLTDAKIAQLGDTRNRREDQPQTILFVPQGVQIDWIACERRNGVDYHHAHAGNHVDPELAGKQASNHKFSLFFQNHQ